MVSNVPGELAAVILAAGSGSRIKDITRGLIKCLLPIANKPMICYPIDKLMQAGFKDIFIIVTKNELSEIESRISSFNFNVKLHFVSVTPSVSEEHHFGTFDSLRQIYEHINGDLLIMSCDTLGDFSLVPFINEFRQKSPSFLAMVCKGNVASSTKCYGSKNRLEKDIIAHDKENRIIIFNSESEFEKNIRIKNEELQKSPEFTVNSLLFDGHVYLIRRSILEYYLKDPSISSLKGELLPSLVQAQFGNGDGNDKIKNLNNNSLFEDECMRFEPTHGRLAGLLLNPVKSSSNLKCCLYIHKGYIIRSNSLMGYFEANKRYISTSKDNESNMVNTRCFLTDSSSSISHNVNVTNSVIGANCKIGCKVKLIDSVIMDGVVIEDSCVIANTVICSNSHISTGCQLDMCLVTSGFTVTQGTVMQNELLTEISHLDIEDLY